MYDHVSLNIANIYSRELYTPQRIPFSLLVRLDWSTLPFPGDEKVAGDKGLQAT